jgi:hypothetical protein
VFSSVVDSDPIYYELLKRLEVRVFIGSHSFFVNPFLSENKHQTYHYLWIQLHVKVFFAIFLFFNYKRVEKDRSYRADHMLSEFLRF